MYRMLAAQPVSHDHVNTARKLVFEVDLLSLILQDCFDLCTYPALVDALTAFRRLVLPEAPLVACLWLVYGLAAPVALPSFLTSLIGLAPAAGPWDAMKTEGVNAVGIFEPAI